MTHKNIALLALLGLILACLGPTKTLDEWTVGSYTIKKVEYPDFVSTSSNRYNVYVNDEIKGSSARRIDSCTLTWQAANDRFVTLNICTKEVSEIRPNKNLLDPKVIDSILIYSNKEKLTKKLSSDQLTCLVKDWNKSQVRGYSDLPFDSAFDFNPPFQYRLTLFLGTEEINFYGYNYLILANSNWKYEMDETGNLDYFNSYWDK
jgi:hypothetical protein